MDALRQLDVPQAPVVLQVAQDCAIDGVHWHIMPPRRPLRREMTQLVTGHAAHTCAGDRDAPDRPLTRDALAIGLATGAYAVSFGVLAVAAGLSVAQACAMSALVFTGASQFAVVGVVGARRQRRPPRSRRRSLLAGPQRRLRAGAGAVLRGGRAGGAPPGPARDRRVDGHGARPGRPGRGPPRVPRHRPQRLRVLEPRHARRRAARQRARRSARPRARRDVPGRLPGAAGAAAAPARRAGRGRRRRAR